MVAGWAAGPSSSGPVFLGNLADDEETATRRLRVEKLMYDGGLVDIVAIFDHTHYAEAAPTLFATFNDAFEAPAGDLPPLIVKSHGGPTGQTGCAYEPKIQFWTSRGFAVLDVNYRGSTGFGRRYRRLLDGKWGIADMQDCVAGARMFCCHFVFKVYI